MNKNLYHNSCGIFSVVLFCLLFCLFGFVFWGFFWGVMCVRVVIVGWFSVAFGVLLLFSGLVWFGLKSRHKPRIRLKMS